MMETEVFAPVCPRSPAILPKGRLAKAGAAVVTPAHPRAVSAVALLAALLLAVQPREASAAITIFEYDLPTPDRGPQMITPGPDGNVWFTIFPGNRIGKITPSGVITQYDVPVVGLGGIAGITAGPDGNVWFTVNFDHRVGKVTPSGVFTLYDIPTVNGSPWGIASGPDGNLWFTEEASSKIGRVTPSGAFTEYSTPTAGSFPLEITPGPDGNLWFIELDGNQIAKATTGGVITEYPIPTADSTPLGIAPGPDGNLWFVERGAAKIGRVTPTGGFTEFPIPSGYRGRRGITAGPDGNLWFPEELLANRIARMTTSGAVTEYLLPQRQSGAEDIAVGPDGNLWLTELIGNRIAKIVDHGSPACPALPSNTCYAAPRGKLTLRDSGVPSRRKLSWQWTGGSTALEQADFGDPINGSTAYTLCLYDQSGAAPVYESGATIPPGTCGSAGTCWRSAAGGAGWSYKEKLGHRDGITKIDLRGGIAGRPRVLVQGAGVSLQMPQPFSGTEFFDQDPAVIVQLHASSPASCWSSTFDVADVTRNSATQFSAVSR